MGTVHSLTVNMRALFVILSAVACSSFRISSSYGENYKDADFYMRSLKYMAEVEEDYEESERNEYDELDDREGRQTDLSAVTSTSRFHERINTPCLMTCRKNDCNRRRCRRECSQPCRQSCLSLCRQPCSDHCMHTCRQKYQHFCNPSCVGCLNPQPVNPIMCHNLDEICRAECQAPCNKDCHEDCRDHCRDDCRHECINECDNNCKIKCTVVLPFTTANNPLLSS